MALEQIGTVKEITGKNYYGTAGKYSCDLVIDLPNQNFPQFLAIECHNDKCDSVQENLKVGDEIKAFINVTSNNYQGRYYTKATLWKFEVTKSAGEPVQYANPALPKNTPYQKPSFDKSSDLPTFSEQDGDLPF